MPNDSFYKTSAWRALRAKVKARWRKHCLPCAYCNKPLDWSQMVIADHTIPRKQRPDLALEESNIVCVHHHCNTRKAKWEDNSDRIPVRNDGLPADGSWG